MTTLNELAARIHEISNIKGFWADRLCPNKYCQHPTSRHPAEVMLLVASEATEAYEAIRDGYALNDDATEWHSTQNTPPHSMTQSTHDGPLLLTEVNGSAVYPPVPVTEDIYRQLNFMGKPVGVPSEIADVIIRALDAAAAWGIDIDAAVERKLSYNAARPHMHGRKA